MKGSVFSLLESQFLGNSVESYLFSFLGIAGGIAIVLLFDSFLLRWVLGLARKTENAWDDSLVLHAERFLLPALYGIAVYLGLHRLEMAPALANGLHTAVLLLVAVQAVRLVLGVAQGVIEKQMAKAPGAREHEKRNIKGIMALIKVAVWIAVLILMLDNFGVRVSAFVTGIGITGIAVALAAQAVLGDLFAYFAIFFDRPFQVGHSIKVGDFQGEVESIGIKTTRLRSLSGEQIVLSNKYLTDHPVQNFKIMARRRALLQFEVEHKTPEAKLRSIPGALREIVSAFPDGAFERAHLKEFTESGLRFECVFFVETPDYKHFMDVVEEVNLGLKLRLEAMGVAFAVPTRTMRMVHG